MEVQNALVQRIAASRGASPRRNHPLVVGICGSQGSGKTTLTGVLASELAGRGYRVASLSLDDLYLTRASRVALAATVHPLLATRGVPGTHDVDLGLGLFDSLGEPGHARLPCFDKACDDRCSEERWTTIETPVDIFLFEGWCVGAVAQSPDALLEPINSIEQCEDPHGVWRRYVNEQLATRYAHLFSRIDLLILLAAPGFEVVQDWRWEQEEELRRRLLAANGDVSSLMGRGELERFISLYERITRHILLEMPQRADVLVKLDRERNMSIERSRDKTQRSDRDP